MVLHILILCVPCSMRISFEEKTLACFTGRPGQWAERVLDSGLRNAVQCKHLQNQAMQRQADLRNNHSLGA